MKLSELERRLIKKKRLHEYYKLVVRDHREGSTHKWIQDLFKEMKE